MNRYIIIFILALLCASPGKAQYIRQLQTAPNKDDSQINPVIAQILAADGIRYRLEGNIYGTDEFDSVPYPLSGANIQITCVGDTSKHTITVSDPKGHFEIYSFATKLHKLKDRRLRVRISYVGMQPIDQVFSTIKTIDVGGYMEGLFLDSVVMVSRPVTLEETVIMEELKKIYQRGDTTVFNTDAYEMPAGSVLLELVRRLPGLQYDDGRLTYMGRDIEEMRLNGDPFFKNDVSVALENIPNEKLKAVKIYESVKDTANVHSGNHLVMDMETKEPVNRMLMGNAEAGTSDKKKTYFVNAYAHLWEKKKGDLSVFAYYSDMPNGHVPVKRYVYGGPRFVFTHNFKQASVFSGLNYDYRKDETETQSAEQQYLPDYTQYTNRSALSGSTSHMAQAQAALSGSFKNGYQWISNLNMGLSDDKSQSEDRSEAFSGNPYTDESHTTWLDDSLLSALRLNETESRTVSRSKTRNLDWNGQLSRGFNDNKNEIGFGTGIKYNKTDSRSWDEHRTVFYQLGTSPSELNRLTHNFNEQIEVDAKIFFNHNFGEKHYAGLEYGFNFSDQNNRQRYYDHNGTMADVADPFDLSTEGMTESPGLSYRVRTKDYAHRIGAQLTMKWDAVRLQAKLYVSPMRREVGHTESGLEADTAVASVLYTPSLEMEFHAKDKHTITLGYDGANSMPSGQLLAAVTDYGNPLYIRVGNPDLENTFNHQFRLRYAMGHQLTADVNVTVQQNALSQRTTYDTATGVSRVMTDNINGTYNAWAKLGTFLMLGNVTCNASLGGNYDHRAEYVQRMGEQTSVKGVTISKGAEIALNPSYGNTHIQTRLDMRYNLDYRTNALADFESTTHTVRATWHIDGYIGDFLTLGSNLNMTDYRGFALGSANRTEWRWNLTAAYKFLKKKNASINLTWYDILHQNTGFSSNMSGSLWGETRETGVTSFVEVSFAYRFNTM